MIVDSAVRHDGMAIGDIMAIAIVGTVVVLWFRLISHALARALKPSESALKAHQEMLAVITRDLQYPINSVALSASVLAETLETPGSDIGFAVENLKAIHRTAFQMNRVVNDLVTSAAIETGTLRVRPQVCDVRSLLQEFEQGIVPLLNDRSIEFVGSVNKDTPNVFVDPDRLVQVLSNLVADAIRQSPPYGVISVSAYGAGGFIQFRVQGPTRPENETEPQPPSDYNPVHPSVRLCKALVEAHEGCMWIDKVKREGTTVFFAVPQAGVLLKPTTPNRTN